MGLTANIFRSGDYDYSNGGISSRVERVTIVNVEGPSQPRPDAPAVILQSGAYPGIVEAVPLTQDDDPEGKTIAGMFGGCYIASPDSRFVRKVEQITGRRFHGAVALHDRAETPEDYDRYTR